MSLPAIVLMQRVGWALARRHSLVTVKIPWISVRKAEKALMFTLMPLPLAMAILINVLVLMIVVAVMIMIIVAVMLEFLESWGRSWANRCRCRLTIELSLGSAGSRRL